MMASVARTLSLIGRALKPGTSLSHSNEVSKPVDALYALGRVSDPAGAMLVHAKMAGENMGLLEAHVLEISVAIFEYKQWDTVSGELMRRFAKQVLREFMGECCPHCKGHGVRGQKLDTVRHRLTECATCASAGFVLKHVAGDVIMIRRMCPACAGKRFLQLAEECKAGKLKACIACSGSGVLLDSTRARGSALGVGHMVIYRVWGNRFNTVLAELRRIDRQTCFECAEFLFGN